MSKAEVKTLKSSRPSRLIVVVLLLVAGCAFLVFRLVPSFPNDPFCTTADPIYLEMQSNADHWASTLLSSRQSNLESITFKVKDQPYSVEVESRLSDAKAFYVSTAETWPDAPRGSMGYIYLYSGEMPHDYLSPVYSLKQLSDHIYCYIEN